MTQPRILYLSRNFGNPHGGIKIIYQHVDMLVRNGYNASILLAGDLPAEHWYGIDVPVIRANNNFMFMANDIVVIPEGWNNDIRSLENIPVRKVVFCQSYYFIYNGIGDRKDYQAYGIDTVFCCSNTIRDFLSSTFRLSRIPIVHNGIDLELFKPREKKLQIAFMPRKMPNQSKFVYDMFRHSAADVANIPWVPINNESQEQVSRILGESAIFLSLAMTEGFGLPPLEAMACNAIVAGFRDSCREYAGPDNGCWLAADDLTGVAPVLADIARRCKNRDARIDSMIESGRLTAQQYGLERMEQELLQFWEEETGRFR
jgi:glycosyltransferase involved in cell wall biosynthesis